MRQSPSRSSLPSSETSRSGSSDDCQKEERGDTFLTDGHLSTVVRKPIHLSEREGHIKHLSVATEFHVNLQSLRKKTLKGTTTGEEKFSLVRGDGVSQGLMNSFKDTGDTSI